MTHFWHQWIKCFSASRPRCFSDSVHTFHLISSTGFYWSQLFLPHCFDCKVNSSWWLQWFLLCSGSEPALSTFHWWTRTVIRLNKLIPAVQLKLWKTHHCDNFRHVWLFKWIFRDVPSCNLCYLSQNKNRIRLTYCQHTSQRWHSGFSFQVTLGPAETCQEMNSRVIQALNVLQMTQS